MQPFDYTLDFDTINFRDRPELYRIGKGEQGVLLVELYKSEILPHWRFKTVAEAKRSSTKIWQMFKAYLREKDFPGADMARKFLQMGWTRGTTVAAASTIRSRARNSRARWMPRKQKPRQFFTNATSPPGKTKPTSS